MNKTFRQLCFDTLMAVGIVVFCGLVAAVIPDIFGNITKSISVSPPPGVATGLFIVLPIVGFIVVIVGVVLFTGFCLTVLIREVSKIWHSY